MLLRIHTYRSTNVPLLVRIHTYPIGFCLVVEEGKKKNDVIEKVN